MKLDILVFGAHPDDVELACSGTIIKHIKQGFKIGVIDLTKGELGTRGNSETRKKETIEATKVLGISVRENMNFKDGSFLNDESHRLDIIKKIRKYRPDIVITNSPSDRHPDHGRASDLTIDSCFSKILIPAYSSLPMSLEKPTISVNMMAASLLLGLEDISEFTSNLKNSKKIFQYGC